MGHKPKLQRNRWRLTGREVLMRYALSLSRLRLTFSA